MAFGLRPRRVEVARHGPAAGSGAAALLERGDELARIDQLIAASGEGEGHVLVIEGRSGVGKSALLGELRSRAGEAGMAVYSARGSELEGELAFGVVRQLFEATVQAREEAEPGSGLLDLPVRRREVLGGVINEDYRAALADLTSPGQTPRE